jgi:uncharacterized protein YndB with AHSA1/START domain
MNTMTAQSTQVYSIFIKATPEAIWEAITKPEFTTKFFYGQRVENTADRHLWHAEDGSLRGDSPTLEWEPPHRLVHGWSSTYDPELAAEAESRVTWEIESRDGGYSVLTVTHDRLEGAPKTASAVAGEGWMFVLSGLKSLLETGTAL